MPNTLKLSRVPATELKTVEELRHQVYLLTKRLEHSETELVQARVSRDLWKERFSELSKSLNEKPPREAGA
jgi:hypothetical protein